MIDRILFLVYTLFYSLCTLCIKLDKRKFKHVLDNEGKEFVCHVCDGSDQVLKDEVKEIKSKLNMLEQLTALKTL